MTCCPPPSTARRALPGLWIIRLWGLSGLSGLGLQACDDGTTEAASPQPGDSGAHADAGAYTDTGVDATLFPADGGALDSMSPQDRDPPDAAPLRLPDADVAWVQAAGRAMETAWLATRVERLAAREMNGRDNLSAGGEQARAYLIEEMAAVGLEPAGTDGWMQPFAEGVNLIGVLPGAASEPAEDGSGETEYVIVSAHYDHLGNARDRGSECPRDPSGDFVCNGALDNASGCAVALAVAKAIADSPHRPARTLMIALFDAEEDGLVGSEWFAGDADGEPYVPLDSIVAVLNADMLGSELLPGVEATYVLGVERVETLRPWVRWAERWPDGEPVGVSVYPVSSYFDGTEEGERNDAYSFAKREVPALLFSSGPPAAYHTPLDEAELVNHPKLLATARHLLLMTAGLLDTDWRPGFVTEPRPSVDDARALLDIAETVLADPEATGLNDPGFLGVLEGWANRLRHHVEHPPTTEAEWLAYERFIRTTLSIVYEGFGR